MIKIAFPRWLSSQTLSSPPCSGTPKLQLFIEQLIMRKTRTQQKNSPITKDIEGTTAKQVGVVELKYIQDTYPTMGNPQTGNSLQLKWFFLQSEWFEFLFHALQPRKMNPQNRWALKARRAYFQERAVGNRDSILKGPIQNLTCSRIHSRAVI